MNKRIKKKKRKMAEMSSYASALNAFAEAARASASAVKALSEAFEAVTTLIKVWAEEVQNKNSPPIAELEELSEQNITTNIFNKSTTYTNCTVEVLENTATGDVSVGWYRTEETEEIDDL